MSKPGAVEEVRIVLIEHFRNTLEKLNILTFLIKLFMGSQISLGRYLHPSVSTKNAMISLSDTFGPNIVLCLQRYI